MLDTFANLTMADDKENAFVGDYPFDKTFSELTFNRILQELSYGRLKNNNVLKSYLTN